MIPPAPRSRGWGDVALLVSDQLPIHPSPGEQARRLVRHGLADVLAWLGEEVGPGPHDAMHAAVVMVEPGGPATLMVSAEAMRRIGSGW